MTYTQPPAATLPSRTTEPDVAVARALGTLTARLARHREEFRVLSVEEVSWEPLLERGIAVAIDAFAPLVPEYHGRTALQLLGQEGAARVVLRLASCDPGLLGRQAMLTMLSARLSMLAVEKGAQPQPFPPSSGALDAFFDATQRRAVRRLIERRFDRFKVGRVRLDFAAAWRTGNSQPLPSLDATVADALQAGGPGLVAMVVWLFFADCWVARANPVGVAYLTAVQLGYERWLHGSEGFRQALTEALVVATRTDLVLEGLDDVGSSAWAEVLSGELVEWAGSILVGFQQTLEQPGGLAEFRVFEFMSALQHAGKRGRGLELIEDHLRRLKYKVVHLEDDRGALRSNNDPGQRIPELYELRSQIASAKLSRRERQVLALRTRDMDYQQIGKAMGINPATARVLMCRVRRAMGKQQLPRARSA